ncbi:MAG: hypothetical protein ACKPH7_34510 [Planktothrix sp.]
MKNETNNPPSRDSSVGCSFLLGVSVAIAIPVNPHNSARDCVECGN